MVFRCQDLDASMLISIEYHCLQVLAVDKAGKYLHLYLYLYALTPLIKPSAIGFFIFSSRSIILHAFLFSLSLFPYFSTDRIIQFLHRSSHSPGLGGGIVPQMPLPLLHPIQLGDHLKTSLGTPLLKAPRLSSFSRTF